MNKISLWLATGVFVALASAGASAATILEVQTEAGDWSDFVGVPTDLGSVTETTTFTGTLDTTLTENTSPEWGGVKDEDYFTFTTTKAITSIVLTNFDGLASTQPTRLTLFDGLGSSIYNELIFNANSGDVLSGPLDLGTYTVYLRETGGGVNDYSITVNAVPLPAAAWLFGSALMGLTVVARRRKTTQISA